MRRTAVSSSGPFVADQLSPGDRYELSESLEAPGVLRNAVPVQALYDPEVGREVTLHHLLQRFGYESLDAVRAEGKAEGKAEGRIEGEAAALRETILESLEVRGLAVPAPVRSAIGGCTDPAILRTWHRRALTAPTADAVVDDGTSADAR